MLGVKSFLEEKYISKLKVSINYFICRRSKIPFFPPLKMNPKYGKAHHLDNFQLFEPCCMERAWVGFSFCNRLLGKRIEPTIPPFELKPKKLRSEPKKTKEKHTHTHTLQCKKKYKENILGGHEQLFLPNCQIFIKFCLI